MAVKLFVGGLSFSTSNERLREVFAATGNVESAAVVTDRDTGRSRGFGFVEMATPEDAEQAISKLNGTSVDGRTIQVERAKSPGAGGGEGLGRPHGPIGSWVGGLAGRWGGRPVVRSRHVTIAIPRRRGLVYRLAQRVITSGEAAGRVVAAAGVPTERIVAIPPGIDTERFHPGVAGDGVRRELGLEGAPVIGLVANIRGSKGHNVFLEAAQAVLAARPAARFLIVGGGIGLDGVRRPLRAVGLA